ncbi:MAG TPA: OsmC family protein [Haliangiales bacterium]|nr:OsmC family protein [Haliangiales bacterium]
MTGTFGGALEARQISASGDRLTGEAEGEVELDGRVLIIRRIHVRMHLRAPEEQRATAERVHGIFAQACPVYRSLHPQIDITTELAFEPLAQR